MSLKAFTQPFQIQNSFRALERVLTLRFSAKVFTKFTLTGGVALVAASQVGRNRRLSGGDQPGGDDPTSLGIFWGYNEDIMG